MTLHSGRLISPYLPSDFRGSVVGTSDTAVQSSDGSIVIFVQKPPGRRYSGGAIDGVLWEAIMWRFRSTSFPARTHWIDRLAASSIPNLAMTTLVKVDQL